MGFIKEIGNWIEKNKKKGYYTESKKWNKWWMPIIAFIAFLWFVIRVIPKPSRIRYPCQRAAFPLAMGFIAWVIGIFSMSFSIHSIIKNIKENNSILIFSFLVILIIASGFFVSMNNFEPIGANNKKPLGVPKGIKPGRVVWNYNTDATSWDGTSNYWWNDEYTDYKEVKGMVENSLIQLSGAENIEKAWDKLFMSYNKNIREINNEYSKGEIIVVKLNLNTHSRYSEKSNEINISPQVVLALVENLIENTEVSPEKIVLYDASRPLGDVIYNYVHNKYPEVKFVDNKGGKGRKKVEVDQDSAIYYQGIEYNKTDKIPKTVTEADYLINIANFKKHSLAGVTFTAKNHFGSIYSGKYNSWTPMHLHNGINANKREMGSPNPLVNLIGHKSLGQKTLLYIIDGLYGGMNQQSVEPHRWGMSPFENNWSSSLFLSQDPIAIDSVALDFLKAETKLLPYSDNYLHEGAQADNPPSGISYDPEKDGDGLTSLGVHEHWNNKKDKLYSKNIDSNNSGIELVKIINQ
ncbi:MAG: DUF362 domain-containing protein [Halanaerobiales bacterium]|nr:DUF362 domain-containing protein [Halanaerobiales bacterium]